MGPSAQSEERASQAMYGSTALSAHWLHLEPTHRVLFFPNSLVHESTF
jgi:hypothetical protein